MMPSYVKAFWWLSVVTVACWAITTGWLLIFPDASHIALAARIAQQRPDLLLLIEAISVVQVAVWCGATLGIAWLAAVRRKNWARWVTAALLLLHSPIADFFVMLSFAPRTAHILVPIIAHEVWGHPLRFVIPALSLGASIAAIVFVFSGNARAWFKPVAATA